MPKIIINIRKNNSKSIVIEVPCAAIREQLVPTGELFQSYHRHTIERRIIFDYFSNIVDYFWHYCSNVYPA